MIALHQSIAEILQAMIAESQEELAKQRRELAEQRQLTKSYFHDIIAQMGNVRDGVSAIVSDVASFANVSCQCSFILSSTDLVISEC
jgi:hypothetical protein